eukprot:GEMP01054809.1.p1 GENE.GEMP01054809.1~~GEMP01054809.1.p1  ORF type:complete len:165 (+),score=27.19 GEMP01054809.1:210-704(+)
MRRKGCWCARRRDGVRQRPNGANHAGGRAILQRAWAERRKRTRYGNKNAVMSFVSLQGVCDDWPACNIEYVRAADRHTWLDKLTQIESSGAKIMRYRGFAMSRLHDDEIVGNAEYEFEGMCWPDGYRTHYLETAKLVPSEKFFNMILRADLSQSIGERAASDDA